MSTNHTTQLPAQPAKKQRTKGILALVGVFLLGGCAGTVVGSAGNDTATPAPTETVTVTPGAPRTPQGTPNTLPVPESTPEQSDPSQGVPVVLEITSNVPVEVSWDDMNSSNTEPAPVTGSWTKELETDPEGFNYFSVRAFEPNGNANAEISCKITVDGTVVEEVPAVGEYASAMCSTS